jgi:hypothetical protein
MRKRITPADIRKRISPEVFTRMRGKITAMLGNNVKNRLATSLLWSVALNNAET